MPQSRYIPEKDKKRLYSKSAGRCNICKENASDTAEIAHIIAHSPEGPRGKYPYTGDRNSYNNLILLCPNCHSKADSNPCYYTAEKLLEIKSQHEKFVNESIQQKLEPNSQKRIFDIRYIQYLVDYGNLCHITRYVNCLPGSVHIDIFDLCDILDELALEPLYYSLSDQDLKSCLDNFLNSFFELLSWVTGYTKIPNRYGDYHFPHFSQSDMQGRIHREYYNNIQISFERNNEINREIENNKQLCIKDHRELIIYIKSQYPEIILT